jgi:hypothetical protein
VIDAHSALRLHLLEPSDLRTLLGGPYVYWPELPAGTSGAAKRVVFRFNGGSADDTLPIHRYTVNFRCYGVTAYEAFQVYRELHDRLVRTGPFIITDTNPTPDEHVAFYNVSEVTPGQPLQDPTTDWFYTFSVWQATVATTSVPAPTFPS